MTVASSLEMTTIEMFRDGMDGAAKRHEALANNLANVNTPNYKRRDVSFKQQLRQKYLEDSGESEFGFEGEFEDDQFQPRVYQADETSMRNDNNNVDPDKESAHLAKNSLYYKGLTRMMQKQFSNLNQVISSLQR